MNLSWDVDVYARYWKMFGLVGLINVTSFIWLTIHYIHVLRKH